MITDRFKNITGVESNILRLYSMHVLLFSSVELNLIFDLHSIQTHFHIIVMTVHQRFVGGVKPPSGSWLG